MKKNRVRISARDMSVKSIFNYSHYANALALMIGLILLSACATGTTPSPSQTSPPVPTLAETAPTPTRVAATPLSTSTTAAAPIYTKIAPATNTPSASPTPRPVPEFSHVIIVLFENRESGFVIGSSAMPNFNSLADQNALLTQYYAITHPSLPNYLALIGGDTFGITSDCEDCFIKKPSLPDLIEASGRTWRAYEEDMPSPCFVGSTLSYAQKHDPFIYFDPIRTDSQRCKAGIVPLTQLDSDLASGKLPNYVFVMPNMCNSGHDCDLGTVDGWLGKWVAAVLSSPAYDDHTLIVLTWDEGQGFHGCCGLPNPGGQVATLLISPLVKKGFKDATPYTHYSLLKTISESWGLELLGHAADASQTLIELPFNKK
jgi:hypothetical protein